jgi:hypothetical protein
MCFLAGWNTQVTTGAEDADGTSDIVVAIIWLCIWTIAGFEDAEMMRLESQETAKAATGDGCDLAASATRLSESEYD